MPIWIFEISGFEDTNNQCASCSNKSQKPKVNNKNRNVFDWIFWRMCQIFNFGKVVLPDFSNMLGNGTILGNVLYYQIFSLSL